MSASAQADTSYAAPALPPNPLLGSLHLLGWIFFRPSAWSRYITHLDPALSPLFALADVNRTQWRNPAIRRLVFQVYGVWVLLMTGLLTFFLASSGSSLVETINLVFSFVLVMTLLALLIPLAALLVGIVVGSLAFSLTLFVDPSLAYVTGSIGVGALIGVTVLLIPHGVSQARGRLVVTAVIGIAFGWLIMLSLLWLFLQVMIVPDRNVRSLWIGVMLGLASSVVAWFWGPAWRWRRGALLGLSVGVASALSNNLLVDVIYGTPQFLLDSLVVTGMSVLLYGLPWLIGFISVARIAERVVGPGAGRLAGILAFAAAYQQANNFGGGGLTPAFWSVFIWLSVGATLPWWRPILTYPFQTVWNLLLYQADERSGGDRPARLRRHAVFWDERQWLPFAGLADHLVLILERDPVEGRLARDAVAQGRQRRAAQAAQLELDARLLERCREVAAIGRVHRVLSAGELPGPASALLRSFSRLSHDVEATLAHANTYHQRLALGEVEERLDGLLRELLRSSERAALRFRPIAVQWRQVIVDHVRRLAELSEQRQDLISPYVLGVPLTAQQAIFVGRTDVSAQIESLIFSPHCPPLLVYGQRRMGKTSLLNQLGRLLPGAIVPLFVDLQGPLVHARDHAGLLAGLAGAMSLSASRQRGLSLPPLTRQDLLDDPFPLFDAWLRRVAAGWGQQTALVMLDEFEALDDALAAGRFDAEAVLGTLRHVSQHYPWFKLLLAGSHSLDELQRWSAYLVNVQVVEVGYLRPEEALRLIECPVPDFALRYTPEASARVLALTRGHPALIQLLCAEIVGLKNGQPPNQRRLAEAPDVEAAVSPALQRGSFFFADIERNQIGVDANRLLCHIAAQGEGVGVTRAALKQCVTGAVEPPLQQLLKRELVELDGDGYRFQVELIRRWFQTRAATR